MKTRLFTRRSREETEAPSRVARAPVSEDTSDTHGLRALSADLFSTIFAFRAAPREARPSYRAFRQEAEDLLSELRRRGERQDLDRGGEARFALVALVDETAMNAEWDGSAEWTRNPLQLEYFGDFTAGDVFFDRLLDLQKRDDSGVLEVYYLCLCAGFRGRYRNDPATLDSIRNRIFQRLSVFDLQREPHITEEAYGRHLERPLLKRRFPFLWALPFVLGAIGLYAAYFVILRGQVADIRSGTAPPAAAHAAAGER